MTQPPYCDAQSSSGFGAKCRSTVPVIGAVPVSLLWHKVLPICNALPTISLSGPSRHADSLCASSIRAVYCAKGQLVTLGIPGDTGAVYAVRVI